MIIRAIQSNSTTKAVEAYSRLNAYSSPVKNSGTASDTATTAQWVEENRYIYDAIMNGSSDLSPMDEQTFMQWWSWAMSSVQGASSAWGDSYGEGQATGGPNGAMNNQVYDGEAAIITATGQATTHDSFAYENTINFSSTNVDVTYEITTDTRLNPPVEILRVIGRNKLTGAEEVFIFDNFRDPDFTLTINTVKGKGVSGTPIAGVNIEVGEYDAAAAAGGTSSVVGMSGGTSEKIDDTNTKVVADSGETIYYTPEVDKDGETEYLTVDGSFCLSPRADCSVEISQTDPAGDTLLVVKDSEGNILSEITVTKGFPVNVNHDNWENRITINGKPPKFTTDKAGNKVLMGFENLSINGMETFNFNLVDSDFNGLGLDGFENSANSLPPEIKALFDLIGWPQGDVDGFLEKFEGLLPSYLGADGQLSVEELQKAITEKAFPPSIPTAELISLMVGLDPQLRNLLEAVKLSGNSTEYMLNMKAVTKRLAELLNALYPGRVAVHHPGSNNWLEANNLVFDGVVFEAFDEGLGSDIQGNPTYNGSTGETAFKWWPDVPA